MVQQRKRSQPPEQSRRTLPAGINSKISGQHGQIQNEPESTQEPMENVAHCELCRNNAKQPEQVARLLITKNQILHRHLHQRQWPITRSPTRSGPTTIQ